MLFSITMDYTVGRLIDKAKREGKPEKAKGSLLFSVFMNLGILGFFKYADFIIGSINAVSGLNLPLLNIPLPIGISFFTFQTMSYTIDVYRGNTEVQKNWISYGTYVSMFPQLIAGPIVQYKTIARQMKERRKISMISRKVSTALLWAWAKSPAGKQYRPSLGCGSVPSRGRASVATAWLVRWPTPSRYTFDFSGYSDMAIGLGKMFGFHFLENFNYPYISRSITEFWRRWHISLSSWFREYVYIPLGGNRKGLLKQVRNIFVVWMLTGIWHGAHWNYVLWGVYYGVLLILEKFVLKRFLDKLPSWIQNLYTMFFVVISWVIFKCEDLSYCLSYLKAMFGGFSAGLFNTESFLSSEKLRYSAGDSDSGLHQAAEVFGENGKRFGENGGVMTGARMIFYLGILLLSVAYLVDATYNPFLYFRF